jgi:hypothetical protein
LSISLSIHRDHGLIAASLLGDLPCGERTGKRGAPSCP